MFNFLFFLAAIFQATSFDDLAHIDEKTLLVLDIDEVVITSEDHFNHPNGLPFFEQLHRNTVSQERIELALSLATLLPKRVLIDAQFPHLLKNLQERGIRTIALTACATGPLGVIPRLEEWRINHLKSLGIDFSLSSSHFFHPCFHEGILFAGNKNKGTLLREFLEGNQFFPQHVLFVDDRLYNLKAVEAELQALGISFTGIHYLGAEKYFKPTNEKVLRKQADTLLERGVWLSDSEVLACEPQQ